MRPSRAVVVTTGLVLAASALASTPPSTPALLAQGKTLYEGPTAGCSACHGLTGEGNGPVAFAIKPPPRNFKLDPFKGGESVEQVFTTITLGLPNTKMVGYPMLPEADRWALAYYVLSFRPKK
jgi:high-affinity iron transporter